MKKIIFMLLLTLLTAVNLHANQPNFTLKTTDNKTLHVLDIKEGLLFQEFKGKTVFLVMFGNVCPPCRAEIPELIELAEKYKDKLEIVAVEVQGYNSTQLAQFKQQEGINYNLVSGDEHQDFVGHIVLRAGWKGQIPFIVVLDNKGEVQFIKQGVVPQKKLEGLIESFNK
ncbi:MAG: TlpA family protein disulfide reductase [Epsilonproteobacteria bacterium]|nr:TlpA family protein disulfide reductase [Campylobacterota bacterium]